MNDEPETADEARYAQVPLLGAAFRGRLRWKMPRRLLKGA